MRKIFLLQQQLPALAGLNEQEEPFFVRISGRLKKSFPRTAAAVIDRSYQLIERNVNQKVLFCDMVDRLYMMI